ncbi:hypothetical protein XENOCAPTIV_021369 [Xenoophorus captivus]|uniref:Uncharacterized protein n=1 Tax=Xenoophorus captivus TaxID=1517983 RepID=A0ABV0RZU8_9TELE
MQMLQEQLQSKLTDLEGRSRWKNVRIYGVPEGAEGSSAAVLTFVEKLIREKLKIPSSTDLYIERAQPPARKPAQIDSGHILKLPTERRSLEKGVGKERLYVEQQQNYH